MPCNHCLQSTFQALPSTSLRGDPNTLQTGHMMVYSETMATITGTDQSETLNGTENDDRMLDWKFIKRVYV